MEPSQNFGKEKPSDIDNNLNENPNIIKHIGIRMAVLIVVVALIFLILYLLDERSGVLAALYVSAYFFIAWLVYLIIETIILYLVKKNSLASANLTFLVIIIIFVASIISKLL